jgi:uncharacterized membrane protein YcaP (DUF421 family)
MSSLFYQGFDDLKNLFILAPFAYFALVAVLRIGGKRTLSKMNSFDFIVTVAMGSILASTLLSTTTSLSEGILATFLLVALQYTVTFTASRSQWFCKVIKSDPTLLLYQGKILEKALKQEHIADSELMAALRKEGYHHWEEVGAVVLENDGSLSVIPLQDSEDYPTLHRIQSPDGSG